MTQRSYYTPYCVDHPRQLALARELIRAHEQLVERVGELERGPHGAKLATRLRANVEALARTVAFEEHVLEGSREARLTPSAGNGWGGEARGDDAA